MIVLWSGDQGVADELSSYPFHPIEHIYSVMVDQEDHPVAACDYSFVSFGYRDLFPAHTRVHGLSGCFGVIHFFKLYLCVI